MTKAELEFQREQVAELIQKELNLNDEETKHIKGYLRRHVITKSQHLVHKNYRHKRLFISLEGTLMGTGYMEKKKRGIKMEYSALWMCNKSGIMGDISAIFKAERAEEGLVAFKDSIVYSIALMDLKEIRRKIEDIDSTLSLLLKGRELTLREALIYTAITPPLVQIEYFDELYPGIIDNTDIPHKYFARLFGITRKCYEENLKIHLKNREL